MAGNSARKGAIRAKSGGNPAIGSGGKRRKALEGRGPTPKAVERPNHKAHKRVNGARIGGPQGADRTRQPGPRRSRDQGGPDWVAGRNPVVEALRASVPVTTLFVAEHIERDDRVREILDIARTRGIPMLEAPRSEIDRLVGGVSHQGVALQVPAYKYAHPDDLLAAADEADQSALIVALDGVTDPRNLGAIVRSAAAFGAHGVVVPERRAAGMTASAQKASAGAASRIPVARAVNLARALRAYADAGLRIVGLDAGGERTIGEVAADLGAEQLPVVLVVGSEGKGLGRLVGETCDEIASIAIDAGTESLNASVAASLALYELAGARTAASTSRASRS
jgi:23S rRNA (guanosine2251-2'-O)-methyltransferase